MTIISTTATTTSIASKMPTIAPVTAKFDDPPPGSAYSQYTKAHTKRICCTRNEFGLYTCLQHFLRIPAAVIAVVTIDSASYA